MRSKLTAPQCTDPNCKYNIRGIRHTCGQCSFLSEVKCACYEKNVKRGLKAHVDNE